MRYAVLYLTLLYQHNTIGNIRNIHMYLLDTAMGCKIDAQTHSDGEYVQAIYS